MLCVQEGDIKIQLTRRKTVWDVICTRGRQKDTTDQEENCMRCYMFVSLLYIYHLLQFSSWSVVSLCLPLVHISSHTVFLLVSCIFMSPSCTYNSSYRFPPGQLYLYDNWPGGKLYEMLYVQEGDIKIQLIRRKTVWDVICTRGRQKDTTDQEENCMRCYMYKRET
jgi:hypothetical protein